MTNIKIGCVDYKIKKKFNVGDTVYFIDSDESWVKGLITHITYEERVLHSIFSDVEDNIDFSMKYTVKYGDNKTKVVGYLDQYILSTLDEAKKYFKRQFEELYENFEKIVEHRGVKIIKV